MDSLNILRFTIAIKSILVISMGGILKVTLVTLIYQKVNSNLSADLPYFHD